LGLRGALYRRLDLWLMRRFDHLIAVSHATKDEMVTAGVPPHFISVLHNGIDTEEWAPCPTRPTLREELGLPQAVPVLGYVGRIMPEKDLDTWLRAAAVVGQRYPEAQFVLVGEGRDASTLTQLQQLATDLGIGTRVHFPGYRSSLLPVYAAFDLFILTSRREGLPNSILEAMALGVPVVTTDVAGTKELVVHGQTGFVLPQGDVQGIAQAMLTLLDDTQLRQSMGLAGRRRVEQEFSFTGRLQRIEALYARLLGTAPERGDSAHTL
jgi:glycosyltransferase involved in cell wall biosynthesis